MLAFRRGACLVSMMSVCYNAASTAEKSQTVLKDQSHVDTQIAEISCSTRRRPALKRKQ